MTVPGDKGKSARRNARLKAALRENLRRRKAQERGRGAGAAPEPKNSEAEGTHENPSR
jgi:hypothetical protein